MQNFQTTFSAMGGENEIVVVSDDRQHAATALEAAASEVMRIQDKYSRYRNDDSSIIHRINSRAGNGEWIELDEETKFLFGVAQQFYAKSDSCFDITSGVLRKIWDLKKQIVPTQAEVDAIMPLVGWDKVDIESHRIRLTRPGMELDFGGFGKEYAADRAADILRKLGITSGFVNLGGDLSAVGPQPNGEAWPVGVENPTKAGAILARIGLSQGGLTTSGNAQKYFIKNGRRYSHIISPLTGFPVDCWLSVSVNHATTLASGFYSTTAMLKERSGEMFLRENQVSFLLVDQLCNTIKSNHN
jgi:FAD:protein FMN transferase